MHIHEGGKKIQPGCYLPQFLYTTFLILSLSHSFVQTSLAPCFHRPMKNQQIKSYINPKLTFPT